MWVNMDKSQEHNLSETIKFQNTYWMYPPDSSICQSDEHLTPRCYKQHCDEYPCVCFSIDFKTYSLKHMSRNVATR